MYNKARVIPVLSIIGNDLVKTSQFQNPRYLGDPVNAVKIFNGKGVDELIISDIRATKDRTSINFDLLTDIASQAFMPLGYGGGIDTLDDAKKIFRIGFEKVVFSTNLHEKPELVKACVKLAGSASVVASIDLKINTDGDYIVFTHSGTKTVQSTFSEYVRYVLDLGVGEIIIQSIDKEGTMTGYDFNILHMLKDKPSIPIIINGGASSNEDFKRALELGYHAVAASSFFVFFGKKKAIFIHYNVTL